MEVETSTLTVVNTYPVKVGEVTATEVKIAEISLGDLDSAMYEYPTLDSTSIAGLTTDTYNATWYAREVDGVLTVFLKSGAVTAPGAEKIIISAEAKLADSVKKADVSVSSGYTTDITEIPIGNTISALTLKPNAGFVVPADSDAYEKIAITMASESGKAERLTDWTYSNGIITFGGTGIVVTGDIVVTVTSVDAVSRLEIKFPETSTDSASTIPPVAGGSTLVWGIISSAKAAQIDKWVSGDTAGIPAGNNAQTWLGTSQAITGADLAEKQGKILAVLYISGTAATDRVLAAGYATVDVPVECVIQVDGVALAATNVAIKGETGKLPTNRNVLSDITKVSITYAPSVPANITITMGEKNPVTLVEGTDWKRLDSSNGTQLDIQFLGDKNVSGTIYIIAGKTADKMEDVVLTLDGYGVPTVTVGGVETTTEALQFFATTFDPASDLEALKPGMPLSDVIISGANGAGAGEPYNKGTYPWLKQSVYGKTKLNGEPNVNYLTVIVAEDGNVIGYNTIPAVDFQSVVMLANQMADGSGALNNWWYNEWRDGATGATPFTTASYWMSDGLELKQDGMDLYITGTLNIYKFVKDEDGDAVEAAIGSQTPATPGYSTVDNINTIFGDGNNGDTNIGLGFVPFIAVDETGDWFMADWTVSGGAGLGTRKTVPGLLLRVSMGGNTSGSNSHLTKDSASSFNLPCVVDGGVTTKGFNLHWDADVVTREAADVECTLDTIKNSQERAPLD